MNELYVVVRGNVTGVGFRAWVAARASALGLVGWVKNKDIGVVEAVFQGDPAPLEKILKTIEPGPDGAIIKSLESFWRDSPKTYDNFAII